MKNLFVYVTAKNKKKTNKNNYNKVVKILIINK